MSASVHCFAISGVTCTRVVFILEFMMFNCLCNGIRFNATGIYSLTMINRRQDTFSGRFLQMDYLISNTCLIHRSIAAGVFVALMLNLLGFSAARCAGRMFVMINFLDKIHHL